MGKIIKLNKEKKMDLVVEGIVYKVGAMYELKEGKDGGAGEVGEMIDISWDEEQKGFWLELDNGHKINSNYASGLLEEIDSRNFLKCRHCGRWNDR